MIVAALYVLQDGPYSTLPKVDLWDEARDARLYAGPHPVVAHPPCGRWGMFFHKGGKAHAGLGDDHGCFKHALACVDAYGGVLEHPWRSKAFGTFGLPRPERGAWHCTLEGGWVTEVDQGRYGHRAIKATWLYYVGAPPPALDWSHATHHPTVARRPGRTGVGCDALSRRQRAETPLLFAELLLRLARGARGQGTS